MIAEILTMVGVGLMIGFSQAAGIGGGTRSNLILMIGMGLQSKQSIALSYILIMGGSIGSILQNHGKKHSITGQPLLNWDLALLSLPMVSCGAMLGTMLQNFLSELIISSFFILYSFWFIFKICRKIYKERKVKKMTENKIKNRNMRVQDGSQQTADGLNSSLITQNQYQENYKDIDQISVCDSMSSYSSVVSSDFGTQVAQQEILTNNFILLSSKFTPLKGILILGFFLFSGLAIVMKGSIKVPSIIGLPMCSPLTYVIVMVNIVCSIGFVYLMAYKLLENRQMTIHDAEKQGQSDIKITYEGLYSTTLASFISGTASAAVGIGGIIFLMPVWLKLKFQKQSIVATTPVIMIYTCATSTLISFLNKSYGNQLFIPICLLVGIIGAIVVKKMVDAVMKKLRIPDCIYILLVILTSITLGIIIPTEISAYLGDPGKFLAFGSFC